MDLSQIQMIDPKLRETSEGMRIDLFIFDDKKYVAFRDDSTFKNLIELIGFPIEDTDNDFIDSYYEREENRWVARNPKFPFPEFESGSEEYKRLEQLYNSPYFEEGYRI